MRVGFPFDSVSKTQVVSQRASSVLGGLRNTVARIDVAPLRPATHVVAAAVMEALANGNEIPVVFDRMVTVLGKLHAQNPVWGPLFVRHPGDIRRDFVYIRQRRSVFAQDMDEDERPAA